MRARLILALLWLLPLVAGSASPRSTSAQDAGETLLYLIVQTPDTPSGTLWMWNTQTDQAHTLWAPDEHTAATVGETLSPQERALMQRTLGTELAAEAMSRPLAQRLWCVWALGQGRLLLLSTRSFCAVTSGLVCFGVYELGLLDMASNAYRPLAQHDLHGTAHSEGTCGAQNPLQIGEVRRHSERWITVSVQPADKDWCYHPDDVFTLLLDLSADAERPAEILARVTDLSLSPTGGQALFYRLGACAPTRTCNVALVQTDFPNQTHETIVRRGQIAFGDLWALRSAWTDASTVLYSWVAPEHLDAYRLYTYHRETRLSTLHSSRESAFRFYQMEDGTLWFYTPTFGVEQAANDERVVRATRLLEATPRALLLTPDMEDCLRTLIHVGNDGKARTLQLPPALATTSTCVVAASTAL